MALGKPAITDPRPPAARDVAQAVSNIRQRIEALEAVVTTLQSTPVDTSSLQAQIRTLRIDLAALTARVAALELEVPTDFYVDGALVGTRHAVNFERGAGITITGTDDETNQRVNIRFDASGVNLTLPVTRATVDIRARDLTLALGRFIDTTRARLIVAGRSVGASLSNDTLLAVSRGTLALSGRSVDLSLSQNLALDVSRAAVRVAGRGVVLARGIQVGRAAVRAAGRDVVVAPSQTINLPVSRAAIAVAGRNVLAIIPQTLVVERAAPIVVRGRDVVVSPFDFYRNFADNSTANLTAYKGTVDASTGELVGTPSANGTVHERVYFDLLPPGSPSSISGAFDISCRINANGSGSAVAGIVWFSQGDDGSTNFFQNGYWVDVLSTSLRFVKSVGGSASVPATGNITGAQTGVHTLRLTHDGAGNYEGFWDGVSKFTVSSETAFSSGRFGLIYFTNPGPAPSIVDYGINYTP